MVSAIVGGVRGVNGFGATLDSVNGTLRGRFSCSFDVGRGFVNSISRFRRLMGGPFRTGGRGVFCHKREVGSLSHPLIPALLEGGGGLLRGNSIVAGMGDRFLLSCCGSLNGCCRIFETRFKRTSPCHLCRLYTFSRRCLSISPFVSFAGSLCITLSFTLGGEGRCGSSVILCATRARGCSGCAGSVMATRY